MELSAGFDGSVDGLPVLAGEGWPSIGFADVGREEAFGSTELAGVFAPVELAGLPVARAGLSGEFGCAGGVLGLGWEGAWGTFALSGGVEADGVCWGAVGFDVVWAPLVV
ncbi:hypothetical protein [Nocardia cyriacigeorgica]|uniref:hypothetical protein n=1 Tax=Nocardia cyriacigeorgica TaxID=135487 RepID=UPI002455ECAE|nr:hypothetical protein [Nocardia cyriacigeorgica]